MIKIPLPNDRWLPVLAFVLLGLSAAGFTPWIYESATSLTSSAHPHLSLETHFLCVGLLGLAGLIVLLGSRFWKGGTALTAFVILVLWTLQVVVPLAYY